MKQPVKKIEYGAIYYLLDGVYHREDGPALEYLPESKLDGVKMWYLHGKLHRLDGPAVIFLEDERRWYYYGERIPCSSQEEFSRLLKLKGLW